MSRAAVPAWEATARATVAHALRHRPLAGVVEGFRWALLNTQNQPGLMILVSALVATALLVSGLYYFRRMERILADIVQIRFQGGNVPAEPFPQDLPAVFSGAQRGGEMALTRHGANIPATTGECGSQTQRWQLPRRCDRVGVRWSRGTLSRLTGVCFGT